MKIKGHTEIQVRDAKTGRMVQHTHDDNMVTNGLSEFMKTHGVINATPFVQNVRQNLITELLGGILLFDDDLDASVGNTHLADGVKMTANAAYGTLHTGDPTELGSYDANESGWQDAAHTTFRLVYNWTESQGNGIIKAAALTSRIHGIIGEGNLTSGMTLTTGANPYENCGYASFGSCDKRIFKIKNNVMYSFTVDTSAQEFTLYKAHISDTECAMNDAGTLGETIWEEIETFANPSSVLNLSNTDGGIVSVRYLTNSVVMLLRANNGFIAVTLNADMDTISSYDDVTTTATGLASLGRGFLTMDADYIICQSGNGIYKIEIANPVNVSEVTKVGSPSFLPERFSTGKRHYGANYVYDETLNKIIVTNAASNGGDVNIKIGDIYQDNKSLVVVGTQYYDEVRAGRNNSYIATVNNLQNAVTKDSTQTMKVIYTLTFS